MNDIVIKVTDLHKTYDETKVLVHALRGTNLDVHRGEFTAIVGSNGFVTADLPCFSHVWHGFETKWKESMTKNWQAISYELNGPFASPLIFSCRMPC